MTQVYAERSGNRCILSAKGHATGSPEVCAGVSAILYALAGYLINHDIKISEQRMEDADVHLEFTGGEGAVAAYEMAVIGLLQIEKAHPEFIQVKNF